MNGGELLRKLLPGVWLGLLATVAFVMMPAAFATLDRASAGTLARQVFAIEAPVSLAFGALLLIVERRHALDRHRAEGASQFSVELMLALGALFCTVAGYYGLQPMMEAARAGGASTPDFGRLHAASTAFFGAKGLLVLALAWRVAR
jgi:hypothetical protein